MSESACFTLLRINAILSSVRTELNFIGALRAPKSSVSLCLPLVAAYEIASAFPLAAFSSRLIQTNAYANLGSSAGLFGGGGGGGGLVNKTKKRLSYCC